MSKYAIFAIAGEEFGIDLDKVFEITRPLKTTPLPNTPGFITGVINLRGAVIPLLDMRKRLNVEPSPLEERIVIVMIRGEKIGLLVDAVRQILYIDKKEISSPPAIFKGLKPEYLSGIGKSGDKLIIILNIDNLLTPEEIMLLGSLSGNPVKDKERGH
ncbi:MAG: chemotaxis protein CheW [Nitrospirae bacterium]|nr:chemotaxis protein CheW [Nitrospirota bacterium]